MIAQASNYWTGIMASIYLRVLAFASMQVLLTTLCLGGDGVVYSISDPDEDHAATAPHQVSQATPHGVPGREVPHEYPSYVSHHPGTPRKPHRARPGDIDQSHCPPERYCQEDCSRAGWPHAIRKWATCSINPHYSAWYVGGGSACIFPHGRNRTCEEGTWGLDYTLWPRPSHVWMKWTHGREQGGLGAYETDH